MTCAFQGEGSCRQRKALWRIKADKNKDGMTRVASNAVISCDAAADRDNNEGAAVSRASRPRRFVIDLLTPRWSSALRPRNIISEGPFLCFSTTSTVVTMECAWKSSSDPVAVLFPSLRG
jgi:hypothetical protein